MAKLSGDLFGTLGGAVDSIFGGAASLSVSKGYKSSAEAYLGTSKIYQDQAGIYGQMADQSVVNARIAGAGQRLQEMQTEREIFKTIGGARSDIAAGGLMESGSALDVLRDSAVQGRLQIGALRSQGQLQQEGYKEEALSYQAMGKASEAASAAAVGQAGMANAQASAEKKSGLGKIIGSVVKIGTAVAPFIGLSDARAKQDIIMFNDFDDVIGSPPVGLHHYVFRYLNGRQLYLGLLAQEVREHYPQHVHTADNGYMMVDYGALGEKMYEVGGAV